MIITFEMTAQPGTAGLLAELAEQAVAEARAWEGCQAMQVAVEDEADVVLVYERWESDELAGRYREWRRSQVRPDLIADSGLVVGAPTRRTFMEL